MYFTFSLCFFGPFLLISSQTIIYFHTKSNESTRYKSHQSITWQDSLPLVSLRSPRKVFWCCWGCSQVISLNCFQAHSLYSKGGSKGSKKSSASSSSSTLTASSSDISIKRYANNKDSLNNNESGSTAPIDGLYREPRLNKSDSAGLSMQNVPLSPNSIDNR